ncbi:alpha/beta hydrolase [Martelella alba]|nr:alpha/beta hydrolase [Martelella alba]
MDKRLRRAGFVEKHFHTGDVILNYVAGPANGSPLVFLHGQSATWEEYTFLMPLLCDRFQVFAVTLRGHGNSSWTPGHYTFNRLGADMTAFLRQVVGQPAIVAGNSSGGVLTAWLAANAPEWVSAIVLEDPPLFRCDAANIRGTWVYDTWLAFTRAAVAGGGGFARLFLEHIVPNVNRSGGVTAARLPPKPLLALTGLLIAWQQVFRPGKAVILPFLPPRSRIMIRGMSQFDGNFARAFIEGTAGENFDHAQTLARITQPVLFLHARHHMRDGRLMGALDDADAARAAALVRGPWTSVRMDCGHAIPLLAPEQEAREITDWVQGMSARTPTRP